MLARLTSENSIPSKEKAGIQEGNGERRKQKRKKYQERKERRDRDGEQARVKGGGEGETNHTLKQRLGGKVDRKKKMEWTCIKKVCRFPKRIDLKFLLTFGKCGVGSWEEKLPLTIMLYYRYSLLIRPP